MTIDTIAMAYKARGRRNGEYLFGHSKLNVGGSDCSFALQASSWANRLGLCIQLYWQDPEWGGSIWTHYTDVTKNLPILDRLPQDLVIVKTTDENDGLRDMLLATGLFMDLGQRVRSDYTKLEVWQLTAKFEQSFNATLTVDPF